MAADTRVAFVSFTGVRHINGMSRRQKRSSVAVDRCRSPIVCNRTVFSSEDFLATVRRQDIEMWREPTGAVGRNADQ
jgi:hypothetical protein